jgi:hypothetical protein
MEILKTPKLDLPYDPVISLLGIYPKECKSGYNREHLHYDVYCNTVHNTKLWKQSRGPTTDGWIDKQ